MKRPDYKDSIVNVSASLMHHYGLQSFHPPLEALRGTLSRPHAHIVLMLFDALGLSMLEKHLDKGRFLRKYLRKSITSVFPSTTVAATTAVLSGKTPLETNFVGWFQYVPEHDVHYTMFKHEDFYAPKRSVPDVLRDAHRQPSMLGALDALEGLRAEAIMPEPVVDGGYKDLEDGLVRLDAFQRAHPRTFTYFYHTQPDLTAHEKGVDSEETKALVQSIDRAVARYAASRADDTLLLIIADHGMLDVEPVFLFEDATLCEMMARRPAIEPRATAFYVKATRHDAFKTHFERHYGNQFKLYDKQTLLRSGLLGSGQRHIALEDTIGDFMSVAVANAYFSLGPSAVFKGHHAGLTEEEMVVPLIVVEGDR